MNIVPPAAILFGGLVFGAVNALTAAGLVLIYRTTRVVNFAQTAIGAAGGALTFQLLVLTRVPFWVAFPAGLLLAGLVGMLFDLIVGRRFLRAPRLVITVFTIAAANFLAQIGSTAVNLLPIFPPVQRRSLESQLGGLSLRPRLPFPGFSFHVGGLRVPYGFPELFSIEVALVLLGLVAAALRFTRVGVAVRAMAANTDRAALLGISVGALSTIVWTAAGTLSGASVILTGLLATPSSATGVAPTVLLPAMAAAVLGRMRSLPVTVGAAVGITVLSRAAAWRLRQDAPMVDVALFVVVTAGLLLQRRTLARPEDGGGVTWEANDEQRPIPRELASLASVQWTRRVVVGVAGVAALSYPFLVGTGPTVLGSVIALQAIVALSVVVLTGWAGQVSLGQMAMAAVGAVIGGGLMGRAGVPFWLAIPVASVATAGFAALVGLPALRIRGLFLAVVTFAFAVAVPGALFNERYFGWLLPDSVHRPRLFLLDFEDERTMYYLCLAALVAAVVVTRNLRRSRVGRALIGMRENEPNLQSLGIGLVRTKLLAFALAGGLAGFAGAMMALQGRGVAAGSFGADRSIAVFVMTVLGGATSVMGAFVGIAFLNATTYLFGTNVVLQFLQPMAPLLVLYLAPGGLVSLLTGVRDSALRVLAQRRHLVVPSLFADVDPDALALHLTPLGPAAPNQGLAVVAADERYTMPSELLPGFRR